MTGLFSFFRKKPRNHSKKPEPPGVPAYNIRDAEAFVTRLEELGYFKYADPENLEGLKNHMIREFDPDSELTSIWEETSSTPKDYRYYFCDNETLFEEGGLAAMLNDLRPTFERIGLKIDITMHDETWDASNRWLDHTITINGKKYTVFRHFTEMGWGEAVQRLVEILNEELTRQGKEDRVYPVSGGNDGRIIFLSEEQFRYIDSVYKNPN